MNEDQLRAILARNPAITAIEHNRRDVDPVPEIHKDRSQVSPPEPERGTTDALDAVVQGETPSQVRPLVRFKFYRVRLLDADARAHGCKDLLDGLVEAGLLPGDREDQIDFQEPQQVKVHYKKDERTEIEITIP